MVKWAIYYGDGSRVTNENGDPYGVPTRNVQAVVVTHPDVGWYMLRANDYYWLESEDMWAGGDVFGLWDYLDSPGPKRVLFGRTIGNREYGDLLYRASNDPDLPNKSAWYPDEKRPPE